MTLEEAIKTDMTTDDLARLLVSLNANIAKPWYCDEGHCGCYGCKEDFKCFKSFLQQEVEVKE